MCKSEKERRYRRYKILFEVAVVKETDFKVEVKSESFSSKIGKHQKRFPEYIHALYM